MDSDPDHEEVVEGADNDGGDSLTLRFVGEESDGEPIHELQATHVAEVLGGLVGLNSDFAKAGAFGDGPPSDVLVRPAREGSFIIEVIRLIHDNAEVVGAIGGPTLAQTVWWATRKARAEVSDFDYLENGNVKILWTDHTTEEVPKPAWEELNKREPRRKKQLREIMAPLSDPRVSALEVTGRAPSADTNEGTAAPRQFILERTDYQAVRPEDEVFEEYRIFDTEARMAAIDFESGEKWRVKTADRTRSATVEGTAFLSRVNLGLALHSDDIFTLRSGKTRRPRTVV